MQEFSTGIICVCNIIVYNLDMKTDTLNAKQFQYKILQKEIKGISPKVSTYKKLEDEIKKLAEELGYIKIKKVVPPQWNNNVQVLSKEHKVRVSGDGRTQGAVFEKRGYGKLNSQSQ